MLADGICELIFIVTAGEMSPDSTIRHLGLKFAKIVKSTNSVRSAKFREVDKFVSVCISGDKFDLIIGIHIAAGCCSPLHL